MTYSLDLADIRTANASRKARWHGEDDDWNLADWSNAMCGEAGEAANKVKKIRRTESRLWAAQLYPGDGSSAGACQKVHGILGMEAVKAGTCFSAMPDLESGPTIESRPVGAWEPMGRQITETDVAQQEEMATWAELYRPRQPVSTEIPF